MSNDDQKVVLMLREYPHEYQGDLTYGSIMLVDLESGRQKKLLSGMEYENTPHPIKWEDDHSVVLGDYSGKYWLLNTNTRDLTQIANP